MLLVIFISLFALLAQNHTQTKKATLHVAFTGIFNVYMWLVAFLYSPALDSLEDLQFKQARKEHEHIMNQFYEQELPDITHRSGGGAAGTTLELSSTLQTEEGEQKSGGPEKRSVKRFIKKDKQEKAKEKLWESIIKETEDEASDSSEEEDHI
jgi:hypothetical protein